MKELIVTSNENKNNYLVKISSENGLSDTKIVTKKELIDNIFGYPKKEALRFLMKELSISINMAKIYLSNYLFLNDIKTLLENNKMIIHPSFLLKKYNRVVVDGVLLDEFIKKALDGKEIIYQEFTNKEIIDCYEFNTVEEEVLFVASKIRDLMANNVSLNNIYLVNVLDDYKMVIKRIFKEYGISVDLGIRTSIFKNDLIQKFLSQLGTLPIQENLDSLDDGDIKNKLIDVLNSDIYSFDEIDKEILIDRLKNTYYDSQVLEETVRCVSYGSITNDGYYFVLGFAEGEIPKTVKDEDYLSDLKKKELGINTSLELNKFNKQVFIDKVSRCENVCVSYSLRSDFNVFMPSHLIGEFKFNVIRNTIIKNTYSNNYNILTYGMMLDNLLKYNDMNDKLPDYNQTYKESGYRNYNNSFTGIENFEVDNLKLSYTSINDYYKCSFKYYLAYILRVDEFEKTMALNIGNIFHACLSHMNDDGFNLDAFYDNEITSRNVVDKKELHFINKLKDNLKFVIDTIKNQNVYTDLNKELCEEKVIVKKGEDSSVTFTGIIDKLKYDEFDGEKIGAIIDYKTGTIESSVDNINYGLNLQLPIYIYLAKERFPEIKMAGFYLQKILQSPSVDQTDDDMVKNLKLEGYSTSNLEILSKWDKFYQNSNFIKSLRMSANGWYSYAKVLNDEDIQKISNIASEKIDEAIDNIKKANFDINPKRIDNEDVGCKYCKYKDICFKKEEDIVDLENKKIEDILKEV